MKKVLFLSIVLLFSNFGYSQDCRPDIDKIDKITKEKNIAWETEIYGTGFWEAALTSTDWDLRLQFGRYGSSNVLSIYLIREEFSQQMNYDSRYIGEKGAPFFLAFTNGVALQFLIQVTNTKADMLPSGKLKTIISMSTLLSKEQMKELKQRFDAGTLNAARISLAGGINFEKAVNDKKGSMVKEKFNCFYAYDQNNPIVTKVSQQFIDLYKLQPNPEGVVVPEELPIHPDTKKIWFSEVVEVPQVSKQILFGRAKKWMVNYFLDDKFLILSQEEAQLVKNAYFSCTYPVSGGKKETSKQNFIFTVRCKDGKFKYEITDILNSDGKKPVEEAYPAAQQALQSDETYLIWKRYVNQQIYLGYYGVVAALKKAMLEDVKSDDDF